MTQPTRKHRLLTALTVLLAIAAIPFVLIGVFGSAQERQRK